MEEGGSSSKLKTRSSFAAIGLCCMVGSAFVYIELTEDPVGFLQNRAVCEWGPVPTRDAPLADSSRFALLHRNP